MAGRGFVSLIVCMNCGAQYRASMNVCPNCDAAMPRYSEPFSAPEMVTSRFRQFQDAAEKVRSGAWSVQEFASFLETISAYLAEKAREILQYVQETGYYEYGQAEVDTGFSGIQDYEAGMMELYEFVHDPDPSHLDQGLGRIWEGNVKINEAMRINREERKKLEEEWGFMY